MPALRSEIELCRFHLGYGNIGLGSQPYTDDGFYNLFTEIVLPNITEFESTTSNTAIVAGVVAVTPAIMTGIEPWARLAVDVGDDSELVVVRSVTVGTFTARFSKDHGAGYPISVECGLTQLRQLLHALDREHKPFLDGTILSSAGLKQVGRGQAEWFAAGSVLETRSRGYRMLVKSLSELLRIEPWGEPCPVTRLEVG